MAKRDYGWFYRVGGDVMSASQFKKIDPSESPCWRFYGFKYLERVREPMGEAAGKGDGHHFELEMWDKLRKLPTHAAPLKAMRYAAAPGIGETEVPIFYQYDGIWFVGFIDLVYDWEGDVLELGKGIIRPLGSTGHTVIHDWKFTGNIHGEHTLDSESLLKDPAANMYAYEAFLGGAQRVSCRWVYTQFEGSHTSREAWAEFTLEGCKAVLNKMVAATRVAWQKRKAFKAGLLKVLEEPCQTTHCFAFRRPCAYKSVQDPTRPHLFCTPDLTIKMPMPQGESVMSDAFRTSLANFPGVQTAGAPVVPPKNSVSLQASAGGRLRRSLAA